MKTNGDCIQANTLLFDFFQATTTIESAVQQTEGSYLKEIEE